MTNVNASTANEEPTIGEGKKVSFLYWDKVIHETSLAIPPERVADAILQGLDWLSYNSNGMVIYVNLREVRSIIISTLPAEPLDPQKEKEREKTDV